MIKNACSASYPLLLACALCGCVVGPDYHRPAVDTPATWRVEEQQAQEAANAAWWQQFDDPILNDLIQTGLNENKDLKVAAARVDEFIGNLKTTRSALFPQIGINASPGRVRNTKLAPGAPAGGAPGVANPTDSFTLGLNAVWQLDFWGKLRRANEAARANFMGAVQARRDIILGVVTSVASAYVGLRDLDRQLEVVKATAKDREDSYKLFQLRFKGGVISELELSQAQSEYEQTRSTVPVIEKAIAQQENGLSVLLGRNPGPIQRGKTLDELALPAVPAGLPSTLLQNRPDILQAEQNLIAANARIGVARAQYFPNIALTGSFGWVSTSLSHLVTGPAAAWSIAAPLTEPLFNAGAISGQVKSAKAAQEQALIKYQQAIQTAFREVEDALVDQKSTREQLDAQTNQVDALRKYVHFARRRYENGYTSYIEVLDAERSLFVAELTLAQTKETLFLALVNLYKAMGGGWIVEADKMTAQTEPSPGT